MYVLSGILQNVRQVKMNGSRLLLVIAIFVVVIVFMMIIASFPLMENGA